MTKQFDFFPRSFKKFRFSGLQSDGFYVPAVEFADLAQIAFERLSFTFTEEHLNALIDSALSEQSSKNDCYTAVSLLKNARIASYGLLPLCQDTGIAQVFGWKDAEVLAGGEDRALTEGIKKTYKERNLRFSTVHASSFFDEFDPANNLPAQIMLFQNADNIRLTQQQSFSGKPYYRFLFCAKGGGSSNKTVFFQGTKAILNPASFEQLLQKHIGDLGTAACPPYVIAVVTGGLSPEQNLLALKLASCGFYDSLSVKNQKGNINAEKDTSLPFRDAFWENRVMEIARTTGLGAQFGGTAFALKAIVLRMSRHGASCPFSIGVSCSAHRNLEAYITEDGIYLEKTCKNPEELERFTQAVHLSEKSNNTSSICLDTKQGVAESLKKIAHLSCGKMCLISGPVLVARDQAHAKWKKLLDEGKSLPEYCVKYPILYAGPAQTPQGKVIGSFGPTTAGRMDSYAEALMSRGAALITIAKGNRSGQWSAACKKYGGVYFGAIGGAAALIAEKHVTDVRVLDYPELGMEAVRLVTLEKLPVFLLINAAGEDFYDQIHKGKMP